MIIMLKNNKGGVGKSWLTFNLGHGLALMGKKVLVITSDSQNNVLDFAGIDVPTDNGLENWVTKGDGELVKLRDNLFYIPLQDNNFSKIFREKLKIFISEIKKDYDYILIDSVPVLLVDKEFEEISDKILIPIYLDEVSVKGVIKMLDMSTNKNKVMGIIPNRFNRTTKEVECYEAMQQIMEGNSIKLYQPIHQQAFITELISKHKSIWESESLKLANITEILGSILEDMYV
ncbi:MAG: ParA family protein [Fusobacteriaceae bacterium]